MENHFFTIISHSCLVLQLRDKKQKAQQKIVSKAIITLGNIFFPAKYGIILGGNIVHFNQYI